MKIQFLLLFCFLTSVIGTAQDQEFSLTGKTADFEDGTYLYFRDLVNGGNLDSAVVRNNSFRFTTNLPEPTLFVMLFTKDKSNFTELWLENNPMTFDASTGDFKEAKVTGSKDQALFRKLREELYADVQNTDQDTIKQREREIIQNNPDALVSAYILYGNRRMNQDEIRNRYSALSEEVQKSSLGQKIAKYLEEEVPEVGDQFIDFSISDMNGDQTTFSDLTGELTLLQFWSSGCGASRMMNSDLSEFYNNFNSAGFRIITVSEDRNRELWLKAIKEDELSWPQNFNLNSSDGDVFENYGVLSTPYNFLIDSDGTIVAQNLRDEELEKKVKEHLNQ